MLNQSWFNYGVPQRLPKPRAEKYLKPIRFMGKSAMARCEIYPAVNEKDAL